jgi:hypothetical protein
MTTAIQTLAGHLEDATAALSEALSLLRRLDNTALNGITDSDVSALLTIRAGVGLRCFAASVAEIAAASQVWPAISQPLGSFLRRAETLLASAAERGQAGLLPSPGCDAQLLSPRASAFAVIVGPRFHPNPPLAARVPLALLPEGSPWRRLGITGTTAAIAIPAPPPVERPTIHDLPASLPAWMHNQFVQECPADAAFTAAEVSVMLARRRAEEARLLREDELRRGVSPDATAWRPLSVSDLPL